MEDMPRCQWDQFVWEKVVVKKHQFIAWLAMQKKLKTKDKVRRYMQHLDLNCQLCEDQIEDHDHLFFKCIFRSVGSKFTLWLELESNTLTLQNQ